MLNIAALLRRDAYLPDFVWERSQNHNNAIPLSIHSLASSSDALRRLNDDIYDQAGVASLIKAKLPGAVRTAEQRLKTNLLSILWHLYLAAELDADCYVYLSMNEATYASEKSNPFNVHGLSRDLIKIVHHLADLELIELAIGFLDRESRRSRYTRIRASCDLLKRLRQLPPNIREDRIHLPPVVIKDRETKALIPLAGFQSDPDVTKETETINRYNAFLADHRVRLLDSKKQFLETRDRQSRVRRYGLQRTQLCAIFHRNQHDKLVYGRKHGGFWQSIPKKARQFLTIDGQATTELDYSAQILNIAASHNGEQLAEDPYSIVASSDLSAKANRALVKKAVVIMLNASSRKKAMHALRGAKKDLPDTCTSVSFTDSFLSTLFDMLLARYPFLVDLAFADKGLEMFRIDAEIARQIIEACLDENIVVLPIHDGFIVQRQHQDALHQIMSQVWADQFDTTIQIKVEGDSQPQQNDQPEKGQASQWQTYLTTPTTQLETPATPPMPAPMPARFRSRRLRHRTGCRSRSSTNAFSPNLTKSVRYSRNGASTEKRIEPPPLPCLT